MNTRRYTDCQIQSILMQVEDGRIQADTVCSVEAMDGASLI